MPPPAPPPPVNLRRRAKTCFCRCRSHCTVWNPDSGSHEGGQQVTRSTRSRHLLDDRVHAAQEKATSPDGRRFRINTTISPSPDPDPDPDPDLNAWALLIEQEIDWLSGLPLSSRESPLVFLKSPMDHAEYVWPPTTSIIHPNHGLYALKPTDKANIVILEVESRICELISYLSTVKHSNSSIALEDRLYQEICRVNREKEIHWAQQRGRANHGKIVVNTGTHRDIQVRSFETIADCFPLWSTTARNAFLSSRSPQ